MRGDFKLFLLLLLTFVCIMEISVNSVDVGDSARVGDSGTDELDSSTTIYPGAVKALLSILSKHQYFLQLASFVPIDLTNPQKL